MKWIKASERLPKMETLVFLKIDGETMGIGNFYEEDQCYYLAVQKNGAHDGYIKGWYSAGNNTEWLDESPSTETGQQGVEDALHKISDLKRESLDLGESWYDRLTSAVSIAKKALASQPTPPPRRAR